MDAVWVFDWRVQGLAFGHVDEGRAVQLDLLFGVGRGERGRGRFWLVAEIVAMGNFAFGGYFKNAYLFRPLLHLEIVDIVDSRTALDRLDFL